MNGEMIYNFVNDPDIDFSGFCDYCTEKMNKYTASVCYKGN